MHGWNTFLTRIGALYNFVQKEITARATGKLAITHEILNFLTGEEKNCLSTHLLPKKIWGLPMQLPTAIDYFPHLSLTVTLLSF